MFSWFKKPEIEVKVMTDMARHTDDQLVEHIARLTQHQSWPYFEERIRRDRDFYLRELVMTTDQAAAERCKGKVKVTDMILMLSSYFRENT